MLFSCQYVLVCKSLATKEGPRMTTQMTLENLSELALRAGDLVYRFHSEPDSMGLEWKADDTPLTVADRGVRDLVAEYMTQNFPDIPVVGEEGQLGLRTGASDELWMLVDEVDGTWAYMLGVPMFTSMFALMRGDEPLMSAIIDPVGKRLYNAERGRGAFLNGKPIRIQTDFPKGATVGFVSWPHRDLPGDMLVPGMVEGVVVGLHKMGCIPVNMVNHRLPRRHGREWSTCGNGVPGRHHARHRRRPSPRRGGWRQGDGSAG
jgi:fructose-1,6-bisphosphatase/inositol monophosphatase family enzyme